MADREKVVRDLRYLKSFGRVSGNPQITEIAEYAIELLNEQDAEISRISKAYLELVGKASKQPQIVRCKDCKHLWYGNYCDKHSKRKENADWFCADGERREQTDG